MKVGIVGLGLMGGSLARALKVGPDAPQVLGSDSEPTHLTAALDAGAVDVADPDPASVAAAADVIVYATPLGATLELLDLHHTVWRPGALVMDVASLKTPVLDRISALDAESRWIGAHPMAGGERSGFEASSADLFRGAAVWLTASSDPHPEKVRAEAFWSSVGARCRWTDAPEHDRCMVVVSHLPQLVSYALASVIAEAELSRDDLGPGGRDMTRLAGSSPRLWRDLLETSGPALAPVLRDLSARLEALSKVIEDGDMDVVEALMTRTRGWKEGGTWS